MVSVIYKHGFMLPILDVQPMRLVKNYIRLSGDRIVHTNRESMAVWGGSYL